VSKEREIVAIVKAIVPKKYRGAVISALNSASNIAGFTSPKVDRLRKGGFMNGSKIQMNERHERRGESSNSRARNMIQ